MRNRKPSKGSPESHGNFLRTTLFLEPVLKINLENLARKEGKAQGEIIREALRLYMREKVGLDPDKPSKLEIEISQP